MRIATWNVNGLKARLEYLCQWLDARKPDIVGLQELKTEDDAFPHAVFAELGYTAQVHGEKAWNGVAVLSRQPGVVLQRGLPGQADFGARLLTVRFPQLDFTTVYCPNGKTLEHADYARKLAWFDDLARHWSAAHSVPSSARPDGVDEADPGMGQPTDPAARGRVLCGDFNICPTPLDTWRGDSGDGEIFQTEDERQRFTRLLELGLSDLYRLRYPAERAFSWWDYRGGSFHRGHGLRIDTLLGCARVGTRLQDVVIDRDYRKKQGELTPSDHAPVFADLADA